jgi:Ca2+-transporting ATPase
VGDLALLEPGEIIPCDGIFLRGHNVKCDESGATGESDAIKKVSYDDCITLREARAVNEKSADLNWEPHTDCFVLSGSKVLEGVGVYVVVAVGSRSFNGRIMMALRAEAGQTPLQLRLLAFAELVAKLGSLAGVLLFTTLMIRFFVQLGKKDPIRTSTENAMSFMNILILSISLIVVLVPEGSNRSFSLVSC